MNFENKKIKNYLLEVKQKAKVRGTDQVIGLETKLTMIFVDDTKSETIWDYEKYAKDYLENEIKRTDSNIIKDDEGDLFSEDLGQNNNKGSL